MSRVLLCKSIIHVLRGVRVEAIKQNAAGRTKDKESVGKELLKGYRAISIEALR